MRRVTALLAAAVTSLELAAELLGTDLAWLPDLLTGWGLAGCGVIAARARPQSLAGPLLASSGLLWFTGNLAGSDVALLAGVGGDGEFLYRAPLILGDPDGTGRPADEQPVGGRRGIGVPGGGDSGGRPTCPARS
jgi:hypothetical protein